MIHVAKGVTAGVVYGAGWLVVATTTIDDKSLVPIGLAALILLSVAGATWRISRWKSEVESQNQIRKEESERNRDDIDDIIRRIGDDSDDKRHKHLRK